MPQMPRFSGEGRGLSLPEVLVASSVLLVLIGAISLIYSGSSRVWRKVDLRTSLIRELQVAARYIERDLEVTHPFGLARADNAVAYLSARDGDDEPKLQDGRPLWQRFLVLYVDDEGRLRRREIPLDPPSALPPSFKEHFGLTLAQFLNTTTGEARHLTRSGRIHRFELENSGHYGSLFELTIVAEQPVGSDRTEEFTLQTKISIRN